GAAVHSGAGATAEVSAASHPDMSGGQVSWSHALDPHLVTVRAGPRRSGALARDRPPAHNGLAGTASRAFQDRNVTFTLFGSGANSVNVLPGVKDDAFAQQVEACAAVHLAFDHLDPGDVAFHGAGAVGQGEPGGDGVLVAADAVGEGVQFGLVAGLGGGEPAFQFLLAAAAGHDLGEA